MANVLFDVYRKEVFSLAKTMVIKHHGIALAMNTYLIAMGYTVEKEQSTWRYYLHLTGEYHVYDKPMYIINLDDINAGEVLLTKTLLENNRITRESYQYDSRFYKELLIRYPEQESLILGMLNPVHINTAISSTDGTILAYDKTKVEDYELYFIEDLEKWIKNYLARWVVKDYNHYNNRYLTVILSDIFSKLPGKILQIRLNYCHTDYVHSYHVKQFLESNMYLGKYVPYMSRKTMMFLYRNIRWIMRHAGKAGVFKLLIERILTEQNIPITEHKLIRTIGEAEDIVSRLNYELDPYPDVKILPRSINFAVGGDTSSFISVEDITRKQGELLGYDEDKILELTALTEHDMKVSNRNEVSTKVLESVMVDNTNSVYFPLGKVLLTHWVYYASTDVYPTNISFINPTTNEQIVINTLDALVLYSYLLYIAYNENLTPPLYIDKYAALGVIKLPKPTLAEVSSVIVPSKVSSDRLTKIMDHDIYLPYLNDAETFYKHCEEIQKFMMRQRYVWSSTDNMTEHAMLINVADMHYTSYDLDPLNTDGVNVLYSDWLEEKGILIEDLERADYLKLANKIAGLATGSGDSSSRTLQEIHAAMIGLMERLSSYSIQYLRSITSTQRLILDWYFPRMDNYHTTESGKQVIVFDTDDLAHYSIKEHTTWFIDANDGVTTELTFTDKIVTKSLEKLSIRVNMKDSNKTFIKLDNFNIIPDDNIVDISKFLVTEADEYYNPE